LAAILVMEITIPELGERRLSARHPIRSAVYLRADGQALRRCHTLDWSAEGISVDAAQLGLARGTVVQVALVGCLGELKKITHRTAEIAHCSNAVAGLYFLD
jgi:hypothetical protein